MLASSWRYGTRCRFWLVLLLLVGAAGCGEESEPDEPEYARALRPRLESLRQDMLVPGAVVLVRSPTLGDWTGTFGTRTRGGTDPIQGSDHWRIGSCTKTMVGTTILQLVEEGRLRLTDPVSQFRPDVPNGANITIEQLLTMRSGLFNYTEDEPFNAAMDRDPQRVWQPAELLAVAFASVKNPYFLPGQGFHYSNTNTILLGLIVEQLTGKPLEQALWERIFKPLGLANTAFPPLSSNALLEPHPRGYTYGTAEETVTSDVLSPEKQAAAKAGTFLPRDSTDLNPSWGWAAGAAFSNGEDLVRYVQVLVEGGLLSQDMQRLRLQSSQNLENYGWALQKAGSFYGHGGSLPGFNTLMLHDPDQHLTVVVWTTLVVTVDGRVPANELALEVINELVGPQPSPPKIVEGALE